jgi:hypothetical protein
VGRRRVQRMGKPLAALVDHGGGQERTGDHPKARHRTGV